MSDIPQIKPGDWIMVGSTRCVVSQLNSPPFGDCEVVFNPSKPTNADVRWTGEKWEFIETGDFGGYAAKYPRLTPYVTQLKRGR